MTEHNIGMFQHVEIDSDGTTVWVNTEQGCIARFGRLLGEVFSPAGARKQFYVKIPVTSSRAWNSFVMSVRAHYRLEVPDQYMPRRFRG